jgi:hypothetical protein
MPNLALVREYAGTVDFDSINPILEMEDGRRWRLRNGDGLLIGDEVTIAAVQVGPAMLEVRAVLATMDPFAPS